MSAEQGGVARYRLVDVTDERDSCDCCGRTNLKRVVVIHDGDDYVFFGSHCAARLLGKPVRDGNCEATAAERRRAQAERTARHATQREAECAEAVAAGFGADLDGINAYVLARACVRFAIDPQTIASRRAGLPERYRAAFDRYLAATPAHGQRDRAHARGEGGHER